MALREDYNDDINAFLTPLDVSDKITSQDVKDAFQKSLNYTEEVYTGLDGKISDKAEAMLVHDKNTNITFTYDPQLDIIKASVANASAVQVDATIIDGSNNAVSSDAVFDALALKEAKLPVDASPLVSKYLASDKTWKALDKAAVGLDQVDNTSDTTKNAATATLTNKTLDFSTATGGGKNVATNIPQSSVAGLSTALGLKQNLLKDTGTSATGKNFRRINGISLIDGGEDITITGGTGSGPNEAVTVTGPSVVLTSLSGLATTSSPNTALRYKVTDTGREGEYTYVTGATPAGTFIDPILNIEKKSGSTVLGRFVREIPLNTINLEWWNGLGITNYSPIIDWALTNHYIVEGKPGSVYRCTQEIYVEDKHMIFNGNNCVLEWHASGNDYLFRHHNTLVASEGTPVTSVLVTGGTTTITMPGDHTAKFVMGDTLKLISNDYYPYQPYINDDDPTKRYDVYINYGEYFNLYDCRYDGTNTTVRLEGYLENNYMTMSNGTATNGAKLCKMKKWTVDIRNVTIRATNVSIDPLTTTVTVPNTGNGGGIELKGSYHPIISNVTFERLFYPGVVVIGTYHAIIEKLSCPYVSYRENNKKPGYIVNESGSYGTILRDSSANGRNMLSTNGGRNTSSTNWTVAVPDSGPDADANRNYGMSNNVIIDNVHVKHANTAIGGHSPGINYTVNNVKFIGCGQTMNVRAQRMTVTNVYSSGCGGGIDLAWGTSNAQEVLPNIQWTIDGYTWVNPPAHATTPYALVMSNPAQTNVGEPKIPGTTGSDIRISLKNLYLEAPIDISNLDYCNIDNAFFDLKVNSNGSEKWLDVREAKVRCSNIHVRSLVYDSFRGIYFNGNNGQVHMDSTCKIEAKSGTLIAKLGSGTGNVLVADHITFLGNGPQNNNHASNAVPFGNRSDNNNFAGAYEDTVGVNGLDYCCVSWKTESLSGTRSTNHSWYLDVKPRSSGKTSAGDLVIQSNYLGDRELVVNISGLASHETIAVIDPATFIGQRMIIVNSSPTYDVTLPVFNNNGTPKVLKPGASTTLVNLGTWVYENTPLLLA